MKHVQSKRTDWATNRVLLRSADVEEWVFKTAGGDLQQYSDRATLRSRLDQALVALVVAKQASAKSEKAAALLTVPAAPAAVVAEAVVTKPAVEVQVKPEPAMCKPSPLNLTNDAQSYVAKNSSKSKSSSKSGDKASSSSTNTACVTSSSSSRAPTTAQPPALTISCHHSAKQQLQQHPPRLSPSTADLTSPTACSTPSAASGEPDSKSGSSSSSSGGSALHMLQGRLLLLLHAAECTSSPEAPCTVFPKCGLAKTLLSHLAACCDEWGCRTPHCTSSRHVLAHHAGCSDAACSLCAGTCAYTAFSACSA
jgi:TAZ zinc finger